MEGGFDLSVAFLPLWSVYRHVWGEGFLFSGFFLTIKKPLKLLLKHHSG